MKKLLTALLLCTALVAPTAAFAKDVTIDAQMTNYTGNAAYLAVYVTNPDGSYNSTLWVSGTKSRYLGDLRGWVGAMQSAGLNTLSLDGITGASVGSGQSLTIHTALADSMIDAGYKIHVESAVEHGGEYPDDVVVPITSGAQTVSGTGYVGTLTVNM